MLPEYEKIRQNHSRSSSSMFLVGSCHVAFWKIRILLGLTPHILNRGEACKESQSPNYQVPLNLQEFLEQRN